MAFLSIEHHAKYLEYGTEEPAHVPLFALGDAYQGPEKDLNSLPREVMLKNIHHRSYIIRAQATKALRKVGALDELEKFLSDPDPRLRRAELVWRFKSIDPIVEKDQVPTRERRRFRDIQLTDDLKDWFKPEYDDSKSNAGRAPIGTGLYKQGNVSFANQSDWGKGEFIVMRTTFEVDALGYDSYRLSILCAQGFHVYLNGHEIVGYGWWQDKPQYAPWVLGSGESQHLKKGTNVIAVYSNVKYDGTTKVPFGQVDCFIEGLKHSDLE